MELYKVVNDESTLLEFINWLPILQPHETYYLCLFARQKYCKEVKSISSDKAQVKRFTSNKETMLAKIRQLECKLGSYTQFRKGEEITIPQEALALYISVNPRDMKKATFESIKHLANCIQTNNIGFNPHQEVMSQIQKSSSKRSYTDIDFDHVDDINYLQSRVYGFINYEACTWLKTRGGFHLLIRHDKVKEEFTKSWYKNIVNLPGVDIKGDNLIPVPGCTQGNFTPHFINP